MYEVRVPILCGRALDRGTSISTHCPPSSSPDPVRPETLPATWRSPTSPCCLTYRRARALIQELSAMAQLTEYRVHRRSLFRRQYSGPTLTAFIGTNLRLPEGRASGSRVPGSRIQAQRRLGYYCLCLGQESFIQRPKPQPTRPLIAGWVPGRVRASPIGGKEKG